MSIMRSSAAISEGSSGPAWFGRARAVVVALVLATTLSACGAINRVPGEGETRSNMHVGGRPEKVALTGRDHEICAAIGPLLREKGQVFVGIDVIGGWLTEINVTSPTGLQELERFDGINATAKIWEAIERRRA